MPISEMKVGNVVCKTLWHTGAQDCFMDDAFATTNFRQHLRTFARPIQLRMFDGSPSSSGPIVKFLDLPVSFPPNRREFYVRFYLTELAGSHVVMGDRWMARNNAIFITRRYEKAADDLGTMRNQRAMITTPYEGRAQHPTGYHR